VPVKSRDHKTAHEKGTDLEHAIGAIERTILQANPNLSEKSYEISFRKIVTVDGVKHEIDVWIEFDLGDGYKSVFIFEAANLKERKTLPPAREIIASSASARILP
jgi:hypothetical protein